MEGMTWHLPGTCDGVELSRSGVAVGLLMRAKLGHGASHDIDLGIVGVSATGVHVPEVLQLQRNHRKGALPRKILGTRSLSCTLMQPAA